MFGKFAFVKVIQYPFYDESMWSEYILREKSSAEWCRAQKESCC